MLGFARPTLFTRIADHLDAEHTRRLEERMKSLNWELFDRAVGAANWAALEELIEAGPAIASWPPATRLRKNCQPSAPTLDKPFADRLLLWKKTKNDLVEEMSTALQMPGWGNSFTQPIANRIEMLSTGVRLPVAVKVFGSEARRDPARQPGDRRRAPRGPRRGRRLPRPDHRQGLRRDQDRPQEGGPLRHQRRRRPGRRRGGDGGQAADA